MKVETNFENGPIVLPTYKAFVVFEFTFLCFVLQCHGSNCRQILGYPSPSQIQGTCDSQTSCWCGDINVGARCSSIVDQVAGHGTELGCFSYFSNY